MKECENSALISSFYHGSALDGDGLRCVIFFSGCNLRCPFCHNPETLFSQGTRYTLNEVTEIINRYVPYIKDGGGVTFSGGEPFLQADFCVNLAEEIKKMQLNTVVETNGLLPVENLIKTVDSIRLDIKNYNGENKNELFKKYFPFLNLCFKFNKKVVLTNVLIPDINDGESLKSLALFKKEFSLCQGIEFLPFKKLCEEKYLSLGRKFEYANLREATAKDIERADSFFKEIYESI